MKRFIDIGCQMHLTDSEPCEFSFYCTVKDAYETFDGNNVWNSSKAFAKDYLNSGGADLERYTSLIPDRFK